MCVAPGSQFFWIGIALFVVLAAIFLRTIVSFTRTFLRAHTAEARAQVVQDHANGMIVHGLWFTIVLIAANACGFGLL